MENIINNHEENELIKVSYDSERPTVSGRDLHEALEIKTLYKDWFPRMCEYGFEEGVDYNPLNFERVQEEGGRMVSRTVIDHQLTIEMAKQICMIQRTELGKKYREYFLELEKKWNSPDSLMARALQVANETLERIKVQNVRLLEDNAIKTQQISEMQPKATYYDFVLTCTNALPISIIAKDYGWSATKLNGFLHDKGVQFKMGDTWILYANHADKGYTKSSTFAYTDGLGGNRASIHTKWTQKGRLFIYDLMKAAGNLPLVEQEG